MLLVRQYAGWTKISVNNEKYACGARSQFNGCSVDRALKLKYNWRSSVKVQVGTNSLIVYNEANFFIN